jgi:hypothetical protein
MKFFLDSLLAVQFCSLRSVYSRCRHTDMAQMIFVRGLAGQAKPDGKRAAARGGAAASSRTYGSANKGTGGTLQFTAGLTLI